MGTNIFLRIGVYGSGDHNGGFRFVSGNQSKQFTTGFRFTPVISRVSCGH